MSKRTKEGLSIARIMDHFQKGTFGFVSAFRDTLPENENNRRAKELLKMLKDLRISYAPVIGKYGDIEKSVFLMNVEPDTVKELAQHFDQESYIWGERGAWVMVNTNTDDIMTDGTQFLVSSVTHDEDFYSQHKGKKFRLSNTEE